jgi:hypothetical protein
MMMTIPNNLSAKERATLAMLREAGATSITWDIYWYDDENQINNVEIEGILIDGAYGLVEEIVWHFDGWEEGKNRLDLNNIDAGLVYVGETAHDYDDDDDEYDDESDYDEDDWDEDDDDADAD